MWCILFFHLAKLSTVRQFVKFVVCVLLRRVLPQPQRPRMDRGGASPGPGVPRVPATGSFAPSQPPPSDGPVFFRLWYEGLTEEEAYVRFIDSYRLRKDEEYVFTGELCKMYLGGNPLPEFLEYVRLAKARQLMPLWWNKEHDGKLIETAGTHDWADINYCVENKDIQEHYGKLNKPDEHRALRDLAAQVYGKRLVADQLTRLRAVTEKAISEGLAE